MQRIFVPQVKGNIEGVGHSMPTKGGSAHAGVVVRRPISRIGREGFAEFLAKTVEGVEGSGVNEDFPGPLTGNFAWGKILCRPCIFWNL